MPMTAVAIVVYSMVGALPFSGTCVPTRHSGGHVISQATQSSLSAIVGTEAAHVVAHRIDAAHDTTRQARRKLVRQETSRQDPPETVLAGSLADGQAQTGSGSNVSEIEASSGGRWSSWFSEEHGGLSQHFNMPITDVGCKGSRCDNMRLYFADRVGSVPVRSMVAGNRWTSWFSEEGGAHAVCPAGHSMTQVQCSGSYCDNLRLKCQKPSGWILDEGSVSQSSWFSEEQNQGSCPSGMVAFGLHCSGSYCDNKMLRCKRAKAAPVDCKFNDWNSWGKCTVSCGGGQKSRTRGSKAAQHGGRACSGLKEDKDDCETKDCPTTTVTTTTIATTTASVTLKAQEAESGCQRRAAVSGLFSAVMMTFLLRSM